MKKKSLSQHSISTVPNLKVPLILDPELKKCNSSRLLVLFTQISSADPFENMIYNEKNRPCLRPILNKHKKNSSVESILRKSSVSTEQSYNDASKYTFSSLLFKGTQPKMQTKVKLPSVNKALGLKWVQREVCTPFFRQDNRDSHNSMENKMTKDFSVKRNARSRFFNHLKKIPGNGLSILFK